MIATRAEVEQRCITIRTKLNEVAKEYSQFLQDSGCKHPNLAIYAYEAFRRMEEFMHRVNDCAMIVNMVTEQSQEDMIRDALDKGRVISPEDLRKDLHVIEPEDGPIVEK